MERQMNGWEGVQRQGQGIADQFGSLAQGLGHVLQSHVLVGIPFIRSDGGSAVASDNTSKPCVNAGPEYELQYNAGRRGWNWPPSPSDGHVGRCDWVGLEKDLKFQGAEKKEPAGQGSALNELGNRLGQAGAEIGACIGDLVGQVVRHLPNPFHSGMASEATTMKSFLDARDLAYSADDRTSELVVGQWQDTSAKVQSVGIEYRVKDPSQLGQHQGEIQDMSQDELLAIIAKSHGQLHKQGSVTVTTTYDSRTQDIESSIVARGDLWRAEASHGGSSGNGTSSPLFLLQVGPILFVRDTTLLIPVHLSKQHLLWYGFDRKNSQHSLCPAIWSKHRRWLLMSMICLNPLTCSFLDLQFPNGQMTYVAGEGVTGSAFVPALGGLLQAQGRHPGNTRLSYSIKNRWGTRNTVSVQLPDRSLSLNATHPLVWKRSGMMYRPTIQLSLTSTVGDRNEGWKGEVIHSPKEKLSWGCGCSYSSELHAFASLSLGRSKRNGDHTGSSGFVLQVEAPLENLRRASFSIQLNSGVEF